MLRLYRRYGWRIYGVVTAFIHLPNVRLRRFNGYICFDYIHCFYKNGCEGYAGRGGAKRK